MILFEDTRQKIDKHTMKAAVFDSLGIRVERTKLIVGDYNSPSNPRVFIDTKRDIHELISNVTQQHKRFREECKLAQSLGFRLVFLIENKDNVKNTEDLKKWYNYRLKRNPKATTGVTLAKIITTMSKKYGAEFLFCTPYESGYIIHEIIFKQKKEA